MILFPEQESGRNSDSKHAPTCRYLTVNVDTIEKLKACLKNGADLIMFGGESFNHKYYP